MRRRVAAVCLVAAMLSGCAGSPPPALPASSGVGAVASPTPRPAPTATPSPEELAADLVRAAAVTGQASSYRYEMVFDLRGGRGGRQRYDGEGQFALTTPLRGWMHLDMRRLGSGTFDFVFDPDSGIYVRGDLFERAAGTDRWLFIDPRSADSGLDRLDVSELSANADDATLSFVFLAGGKDVRLVNRELLDGVATNHYQVTVDLDLARERATAAEKARIDEYIAKMRSRGLSSTFEAEGWVDDQDLIRRVRYIWTFPTLKVESTVTMDLSAFGEPVELDVPPRSETVPFSEVLD